VFHIILKIIFLSGVDVADNGFQEVRSKKTGGSSGGGKEGGNSGGNGARGNKEEMKRGGGGGRGGREGGGRGGGKGGKEKGRGGGLQSSKSFTSEWSNNKPPRMQRQDDLKKQYQHDPTHDLNKINQASVSLFPISRGNTYFLFTTLF
jgi:hypothetical protein